MTTKNGRRATLATCMACGSKKFHIGNPVDAEELSHRASLAVVHTPSDAQTSPFMHSSLGAPRGEALYYALQEGRRIAVTTRHEHRMNALNPGEVPVPMPDSQRIRRRRTFTMEDESYERLSELARAANTNRSRFLEHLILMAEQVLSWQPPTPPKRPWWKFWQPQPQVASDAALDGHHRGPADRGPLPTGGPRGRIDSG